MYQEFRKTAIADARRGIRLVGQRIFVKSVQKWRTFFQQIYFRYGIECLFRFYSYGLEKKFREDVFRDFQTDTMDDYEAGELYGLEKFWAFLKYSGHAGQGINPKLKATLAKFKQVDDFRVVPPKET